MLRSWLEIHERRLIDEWAKKKRILFEGDVPRCAREARARFVCPHLGGGPCELEGIHCARRHLLAIARNLPKVKPQDSLIFWNHRDDKTCATCLAGEERARLLGIGAITDWRARWIAQQRKRGKTPRKGCDDEL